MGQLRPTLAPLSPPPAPEQLRNQGGWGTVWRDHWLKQKPRVNHQPIHLSNRISLLRNQLQPTPIYILRNVIFSTPVAIVQFILGAGAGNTESNIKLLAKSKHEYGMSVIHVGSNDVRPVFSGSLLNRTSDDMLSCMSSFNRWLSRWCSANDVGFIDNWQTFWRRSGLIRIFILLGKEMFSCVEIWPVYLVSQIGNSELRTGSRIAVLHASLNFP